ncbi:NAD-dependent epimerase/dehydratase family protein [Microbacterium sp. ET2]|uniref:NAD-dependent epimerase/dehydratase family protein n=1 Tax=Microbacterium albipurpureum TaxID=3050384 RepID=UPI00259CF0C6|nr:NAD-dependent epimerase/dehydratase family protein [Microbacterium sp. ET2 (Ac-2212)]WJL95103.1 NAD-dependent epimerase/dehydratase family protein [Microbacterium sp. ET2 (Ac-2212)]
MTRRWIIGRGLLGRAIARVHDDEAFATLIPWAEPDSAVQAMSDGLSSFAEGDDDLEIYWSAGRGVTSTPAEQLEIEVDVFRRFLLAIMALPPHRRARLTFFLASSVGGAYAGSGSPPFTEATPTSPLSNYGRAKLQMEQLLTDATSQGGWRSFIGRITNIYGAGQDLTKAQGLISALIRGHLNGQPIPVYVPLDTLRDYIYEDDCAAVVAAAMRRTRAVDAGSTVVKIIGTMRAVSIGALLAELTRLRRRRGPIVLGGGDARGQSLDLRVKSIVWPELDGLVRTTLPEGLSRVYAAQLSGRLNPL